MLNKLNEMLLLAVILITWAFIAIFKPKVDYEILRSRNGYSIDHTTDI
jgi:hypothetical protein